MGSGDYASIDMLQATPQDWAVAPSQEQTFHPIREEQLFDQDTHGWVMLED